MSPLVILGIYAALLKPVLLVAMLFYSVGFLFHARIKKQGPRYDVSRRAAVLRWVYILLGGPICTVLIACLIGLIGGELRPESQALTIGLAIVAGIALMYLSSRAFMAATTLGVMHGVRAHARQRTRTAREASQA